MMNNRQQALVSLLIGSFPNFQSGDPEAALAAYELVLNETDQQDHRGAVMMIIEGRLEGHDVRFAPTAPQLARAIRQCAEKRLVQDHELAKLASPPPEEWEPDEQQRQRSAAMLQGVSDKLSAQLKSESAAPPSGDAAEELVRQERERWKKLNDRFQPDMSVDAVAKRLGFKLKPVPTKSDGEAA